MLGGVTNSMDTSLSKFRGTVKDRGAQRAVARGVTETRTRLGRWAAQTLPPSDSRMSVSPPKEPQAPSNHRLPQPLAAQSSFLCL